MEKIYADNSHSIGRTPLIRLNSITAGLPGIVLGKIEGRNPAYSVKCRIGAAMIWAAEKEGKLTPGSNRIDRLGAHKRQYRHIFGLCLRCSQLSASIDHA